MRVLVVGGTGLLGGYLARAAMRRGHETIATFHSGGRPTGREGWIRLDLASEAAVARALDVARPEAVVNAAGYTDVDGCEREPGLSAKVNVAGAERVAEAAARSGARLVHFSTDAVFDGEQGGHDEGDAVHPISEYGRQKLESERRVLAAAPEALILRVSVLYGLHASRKDFVRWLRDGWQAGLKRPVVTDQIVTPTYAGFAADATLDLLERGTAGTFHVAGSGALSRFEFARLAARILGADEALVVPALMSQMPWIAARPKDGSLRTGKLARTLGRPIPTHESCLRALADELAASAPTASGARRRDAAPAG